MNNSKSFFNVVLVLGLIILIVVIYNYNSKKSTKDNYTSGTSGNVEISGNSVSNGNVSNGNIVGINSNDNNYLPVSGLNTGLASNQQTNPSDLLPKDMNSQWSNINPASADLQNINLLPPTSMIGQIGSVLKNPSLQIRSEPIIPKTNIGPWNQSTIDADTLRRPLEIGQGDL